MGNEVTRFPGGVGTVNDASVLADLPFPDPTRYHTYMEDFGDYTATEWILSGTGSAALVPNGPGGVLLLTNTALDDAITALQKNPAVFSPSTGKKLFFKARFRVNEAIQSDFVMGLQIIDTTPLDVTDGFYFLKVDGSASVSLVSRKDATTGSTSVVVGNMPSNDYVDAYMFFDGANKLVGEIAGARVGLDITNFRPDATALAVSFGIQNGEAVIKTMSIDYIFVAAEK